MLPERFISQNTVETGVNDPIAKQEIEYALHHAKNCKSTGYDELPVEIVRNETAKKFLFTLFNICFEKGMIPSMWSYGIINPIPKYPADDPRVPLNYCGIVFASAIYKLYCSVLNNHLCKWADANDVSIDEQNGFRQKQSCLDHLTTISNIIESRKLKRKSTFIAFVDFSKAFD